MTDEGLPEEQSPKGLVVEPTGNVEEAPDDGLDEIDDEDDEVEED